MTLSPLSVLYLATYAKTTVQQNLRNGTGGQGPILYKGCLSPEHHNLIKPLNRALVT